MKTLPRIIATAEQLPLISQNRFGVEVICGAAGSGKTSTALLRLRSLCYMFAARHVRQGNPAPVRVLVLTFNRTLAGYVRSLAEHQINASLNVDLQIETFGRWAMMALDYPNVRHDEARRQLRRLSQRLGVLTPDYIVKEVEYLLGRFEPEQLERYVTAERTGRGALPRVDRNLRRRILDEIVAPYQAWLAREDALDWNGVAVRMARDVDSCAYDVVVVDESQDFSANQLRAVRHHLAPEHAVTFVIDTVQRIYARGFTWAEAGYDEHGEVPRPAHWANYIDRFTDLSRLIEEEPQLATFWRSAWENSAGMPVDAAVKKMSDEARHDLDVVARVLERSAANNYHEAISQLGCLTPKFRGSGFKTALAALVLAHLYRDQEIEDGLVSAANELESDTDTIATMAGAILGAVAQRAPDWPIQDIDYISQEARRLAAIARGVPQDSFTYPDLGHWNPPAKQNAGIGRIDGQLAIAGLGKLTARGPEYRSGDATWQWFALPFGQTIFAKRKSDLREKIVSTQLPGPRQEARSDRPKVSDAGQDGPKQSRLPWSEERLERPSLNENKSYSARPAPLGRQDNIDRLSDEAIYSDFDDLTLGQLLNRCIDQSQSVDAAIGFAAIVAKAKLARRRRGR